MSMDYVIPASPAASRRLRRALRAIGHSVPDSIEDIARLDTIPHLGKSNLFQECVQNVVDCDFRTVIACLTQHQAIEIASHASRFHPKSLVVIKDETSGFWRCAAADAGVPITIVENDHDFLDNIREHKESFLVLHSSDDQMIRSLPRFYSEIPTTSIIVSAYNILTNLPDQVTNLNPVNQTMLQSFRKKKGWDDAKKQGFRTYRDLYTVLNVTCGDYPLLDTKI